MASTGDEKGGVAHKLKDGRNILDIKIHFVCLHLIQIGSELLARHKKMSFFKSILRHQN